MGPHSPAEWWPLFQKAMHDGDLDAVLALYEPGAVFVNRSGRVRSGLTELREEIAPNVEGRANFQVDVTKIIESGELALLHSEWRITQPLQASGYALEVLRRQPHGRWLLAIGDPFSSGPR